MRKFAVKLMRKFALNRSGVIRFEHRRGFLNAKPVVDSRLSTAIESVVGLDVAGNKSGGEIDVRTSPDSFSNPVFNRRSFQTERTLTFSGNGYAALFPKADVYSLPAADGIGTV